MDVDLDRPVNDEDMEYEEAEPSTGIPIEADGTIEEVLQDDEVMDVNTGIAESGDAALEATDGDVDLEVDATAEGDGGIEGDMEPEPTPIPGAAESTNPFFDETAQSGEIEEIAEEVGAPEEMQPEAADEGLAVPDETSEKREEGARGIQDDKNPLMSGSVTNTLEGVKSEPGVATGSSSSSATMNSTTTPNQAKPSPTADDTPGDIPAAEASVETAPDQAGVEYAGDDEEYYEDAEAEAVDAEAVEPSSHTASEADPDQNFSTDADEAVPEEETEENIGEDDAYDPDEMLTINTLPAIILHLPDQPPKSLFFPLDGDEKLPDGISTSTPVWLEDKVEELAQVSIDKLLEVVRREIEGDGKGLREGTEIILEEKGLGLRLGEHDKNLSRLTLLEYLQVHHSCDLPTPVQFFVTFQQSRFWDRFDAIRKELVVLAERRKLTAAEQVGGEGDDEGGDVSEGEGEEADGYVTDEDPEQVVEVDVREARRPKEDDARARYGDSQDGDARREKQRAGEESAHPNADWARNLPTGPMAFGVGEKAPAFPRSKDSPQHTSTPLNDEPAHAPEANKGRFSAKPDISDRADTTEASDTDSRQPAMNGVVPLDEVALKQAQENMQYKKYEREGTEATSYNDEDEGYDDEIEGEEVIDDTQPVGKDAVELKKEDDALDAKLAEVDTTETVFDEGVDLTFDQQRALDEAGEFPKPADTAESTFDSIADVPLGDVEVGKLRREVPASTTSVLDSSLAASSITDRTSGAVTPTPGTPTEAGSRERSSLANEVFPDETADGTVPTTIAEEDEEEHDDEEEADGGDDDFTVDADKIVAYSDEEAAESEGADEPKRALKLAVEEGVISEDEARKAVGDEKWEDGYEGDDGYVVAEEAHNLHHGPEALDNDDEEVYDEETVSPLGSKRGAEDEDEVTSSKRARFPL